jgi:predicted N-acetyltransferase YhbS
MTLIIRPERPEDYRQTELITQKAFWNLHNPGCSEHLLVRKLRTDPAYMPELSRVAELDGKVVGTIMYSRSKVIDGEITHPLLTFGPLCVEPTLQNTGIGAHLMQETFQLARDAGYSSVIIFGEPGYYPRFGFVPCERFAITTADGKNFDAFMALELIPGGLANVHGKFYEAEVFENLPDDEVEEFNKQFPYLEKLRLPGQWGYEQNKELPIA